MVSIGLGALNPVSEIKSQVQYQIFLSNNEGNTRRCNEGCDQQ